MDGLVCLLVCDVELRSILLIMHGLKKLIKYDMPSDVDVLHAHILISCILHMQSLHAFVAACIVAFFPLRIMQLRNYITYELCLKGQYLIGNNYNKKATRRPQVHTKYLFSMNLNFSNQLFRIQTNIQFAFMHV